MASENGHIEIVKLLLEQKGIDINIIEVYSSDSKEELYLKIRNSYKLLRNALILASEKGETEIVKMLLEQEEIDITFKGAFLYKFLFISII